MLSGPVLIEQLLTLSHLILLEGKSTLTLWMLSTRFGESHQQVAQFPITPDFNVLKLNCQMDVQIHRNRGLDCSSLAHSHERPFFPPILHLVSDNYNASFSMIAETANGAHWGQKWGESLWWLEPPSKIFSLKTLDVSQSEGQKSWKTCVLFTIVSVLMAQNASVDWMLVSSQNLYVEVWSDLESDPLVGGRWLDQEGYTFMNRVSTLIRGTREMISLFAMWGHLQTRRGSTTHRICWYLDFELLSHQDSGK